MHGLHDEQDMKRMGALRKWMPITAGTFIVGWLAIAGIPPFAGFWSKDEVLLGAWDKSKILWAIGAVTALLTAYYMSRQVFLVFFGKARWQEDASAEHGAHGDFKPHESPWTMALPLVALAGLATVGGALNLPFSHDTEFLTAWLEPLFGSGLHHFSGTEAEQWMLAGVAVVLALIGIAGAYAVYLAHKVREESMEPALLRNAWYVDDFVAAVVNGPVRLVAAWSAYVFDLKVIDGAVNGIGNLVRDSGGQLRKVQTGFVRNYALAVAAGAVALFAFVVLRTAI
jgi:NADH-quinone oxidoreductase subunit L